MNSARFPEAIPKQVLIVGINYAPEQTGIAPYMTRLAEGLQKQGYNVSVVTGFPHYPQWKRHAGYKGSYMTETINGVRVYRLRHFVPSSASMSGRVLMEATFAAGVLAFLFRHSGGIYICSSPTLLSAGAVILRGKLGKYRPPVAIWVQDLYSLGATELATKAMSRSATAVKLIESWILRNSTEVVSIHPRFSNFIETELGVGRNLTTLIRNWTHNAKSSSMAHSSATVSFETRWPSHQIIALHAGNMGQKQGLQNLIGAARAAQEQTPGRILFVLMGDGNQRAKLEKEAAGVENILFVDPLPGAEFTAALRSATVLIVNEARGVEGMAVPSKLTSYFSSGRPVVAATAQGGPTAEEVRAAGGGVIVEPGNPQAMVDAIQWLSANEGAAAQFGANGQKYVQRMLTESQAIQKFEHLISRMATSTVADGSNRGGRVPQ